MSLAFLGDSLTYGWLTEGVAAWETFASRGAQNFGVPGDLTDDVLERIEAGELDAAHPSGIVLLVGTNDLGSGRSPERTALGVETCVRALLERFPNVCITLLGLLPRGDGGARGSAQIATINRRLERLAEDVGVRYVDCAPAFVETAGTLRTKAYDADLLHLSPAGYAGWAGFLNDAAVAGNAV